MLSAISSRKATGRRVSGNLGIVGYCLPPSHLGYSSILDSTRFGVGSSKLDSALAAPLIPATEPESLACYPQEIPGQARDEAKTESEP